MKNRARRHPFDNEDISNIKFLNAMERIPRSVALSTARPVALLTVSDLFSYLPSAAVVTDRILDRHNPQPPLDQVFLPTFWESVLNSLRPIGISNRLST